jgi:hypothetical protein|tara:strand:- start:833 stop:1594 length:762 start_codon:yes stop_codon:yes gene_type:complete
MLFEKFIPVYIPLCIELSEARRKETESLESSQNYLSKLQTMMGLIQQTPLKKTPLFEWHGINSSCWKFEEYRAMSNVYDKLILQAQQTHINKQFKETKNILTKALGICKQMISMRWERTPFVYSMPELQVEYQLSKLFFTRSLYCYNVHSFKHNHQVIRIAFQLAEISNKLWKLTANTEFEHRALAEYHYTQADRSNFKDKLSHISQAYKLAQVPHIEEMYKKVTHLNETVHYESVVQVGCPVLTIEQALSKC